MNHQTEGTASPRVRIARRVGLVMVIPLLALVAACSPGIKAGPAIEPVSVTNISGETLEVPSADKPTVMVFYSVGCGTCVGITQHIAELAKQYPDATYLAVNIDATEDVRTSNAFLDYIDSPAITGINDTDGQIAKAYNVTSVSTVVVTDADGGILLDAAYPPLAEVNTAVEQAAA
ncbi:MAG: redoxin domain-containing protein [Actinobacteria bacterium]|nr:redoxin domain-containing protein [Actinomycetota bacterium]